MTFKVNNIGVRCRSLDDKDVFVHSDLYDRSAIVPKDFAALLTMCAKWDTPESHAQRITATLGLSAEHVDAVSSLLAEFVEQGLLAHENEIRFSLERATTANHKEGSQVTSLVIVSRNRPSTLLRCVHSYVENLRRFGRAINIVIFDDTDEIRTREQTVARLSTIRYPDNVGVFYYGPEHKSEFARRLAARAKCDPALVQFAICGAPSPAFAAGASHNAALLITGGEIFVTVDDDTVCDVGELSGSKPTLRLSSTPDPTEWWFARSREEACSLAPTKDMDLISCYEQVLGRTVASLVQDEDRIQSDDMNSAFFKGVTESNASIGICALGLKGDCALIIPALYLTLEGASYDRLVSSEAIYRNAFISREVVRCAPQITISNTATCLTNNLGIDNRRLLPPFLPKQYGDDILFCMLVNLCRKDTFSAHLPLAVLHDADPTRAFKSFAATEFVPGTQAAHIIAMLIERFITHFKSDAPEDNLSALGRYFQVLGTEPRNPFRAFIKREWMNQTARSIALLNKRISRISQTAPAYSIEDLKRHSEVLKRALLKGSPTPIDMVPDGNESLAWECFQELLRSYGQLLERWPEIVESARAVNATRHDCAIAIKRAEAAQALRCGVHYKGVSTLSA